ncbi:cytochrome P450 [Sphaerisporangium rufum]|uniref:Cytochrome P450 n=2 Tax=Sphaerisporangium rufum TaxID=1381558 RepID=A0A919R0K4_9ACTN|nr:cytochrome P450 [Sphaerisporangium rufum]GII77556.1 cytochrome P450 [Sphaerisporangium rufum]
MRRDQVGFLGRMIDAHGDIVAIRVLGIKMIMLNHPDYFERVLVRNHENYDKSTFLFRAVEPILRGGLIGNVGGEPWRRQRRIMQPSFHRPKVAGFAENMTDETARMLRRWDRQYGPDDVVNVSTELGQLAMRIVFRSLFGAEVGARGDAIEQMFLEANQIVGAFFRFPFPPLSWPTRPHRRLNEIIRTMDGFVSDVIRSRIDSDEDHLDLLTALMNAVDEETGTGMTPLQLHREVLNIIIGGYETTSNSVAWLIHLIGQHPDVQARLHAEVDEVLGGRVPAFDDVPRLVYTRMIVDETLRLYTPAWQTMRRAIEEDEMGGYRIPAGSDVYLNMFTLHRHPEYWPDPHVFDPERFTPEQVDARPRHAYIPFASGPRNCIGKHFALTELTLILAMVAQAYRVEIPEERRYVEIEPLITMHPKGGIHARMARR